jgi:Carboxypeptidase regulatory-like domain
MRLYWTSARNKYCWMLLLELSFCSALVGQVLTGEIDGTVYDKTGAAIPNAVVAVKNDDQNLVTRTVETNAQGQFTVPLLPLAHYSISVNAQGFQSEVRTLEVHTGITSAVAFTLAPGNVTQSVEITTDTTVQPQVDNAASGTLIPSTKITQLSLSSRNFEQLLSIEPGVSGVVPGGTLDRGAINATGGVNSATYEVNGLPPSDNGYFLDGQDLQRRTAGGTQIGAYPGIDFIQEMNPQRANYGAQYGGSGSAFLSITSKSGNAAFHGSAYEFFRSQVLNANDYFNNLAGVPRPAVRYSDFGYVVGGPIWLPHVTSRQRVKTFFAAGQEFLRSASSVQATLTNVPTSPQRQGIFNAPVCTAYNTAGKCTTSATAITAIDPEAQAYLKDVINKTPLPNSPTDPQGLITAEPGTNNETQTFVRIDHHFNDRFSVMFRFFNDPFNLTVPSGLRSGTQAPGVGIAKVTDGSRAYFATGTFVFGPKNVLQAGGGYFNSYVTAQAIGSLLASNSPDVRPTLPLASTLGRIPNLTIGGSTYTTISPYNNREPQTQLFANDTQILGRHTLTFGFNIEYQKAGNNTATTNAGAYTFSPTTVPTVAVGAPATQFDQAFANFLLGSVTSFQQISPDPATFPHTNLYDGYIQDDFHARTNLTLNLGVRYSYFAVPSSGTLKGLPYLPFINFVPSRYNAAAAPAISPNGLVCVITPCNGGVTPNPAYNPENGIIIARLNSPYGSKVSSQPNLTFAPRFGFAYNMGGKGTTAIRGGFGIYYIQVNNADYQQLATANQPNVTSLTIPNTNFSNPGAAIVGGNPSPLVVKAAQANTQPPYIESYSLDVQRTLPASTLLDVGYYGNRALHLNVNEDINELPPGLVAQKGIISGNTVTSGNTPNLNVLRPYLGYGPINSDVQGFVSNYNGLQVSVTKRFRQNSLATANYTYSRTLSNAVAAPQNVFNPAAEWGPDANMRPNTLNVNFVYSLPFFDHDRSLAGYALGGWEFSGIVSFGGGQYLTAHTSGVDPAGQGILASGSAESGTGRPDLISNPNSKAPHTLKQWFNTAAFTAVPAGQYRPGSSGVGTIKGPGYEEWDLSLFKNLHLGGEREFQFRFETFNALNHVNFNAISTTTSATNYGQVTSDGSPRVVQLGAKFLF